MTSQDMYTSSGGPVPEAARKIFERERRDNARRLVTAAMLAAHVAFESGKSYVAKNVKNALKDANLLPHVEGKGQLGDEWIYDEILPFLRTFGKGRARDVTWPDNAKGLSGGKSSNKNSEKTLSRRKSEEGKP